MVCKPLYCFARKASDTGSLLDEDVATVTRPKVFAANWEGGALCRRTSLWWHLTTWLPVTAVRQPLSAIGKHGVPLLLDRMRGDPIPLEPQRSPVTLVTRASVVAPPGIRVWPLRAPAAPNFASLGEA